MNDTPLLFNFHGTQVRMVDREGDPWFVAGDVAEILEYRDAHAMFRGIDPEDRDYTKVCTSQVGDVRRMSIISEPGLYTAIVRANTDRAKPFRRWITSEVLPSIRITSKGMAELHKRLGGSGQVALLGAVS